MKEFQVKVVSPENPLKVEGVYPDTQRLLMENVMSQKRREFNLDEGRGYMELMREMFFYSGLWEKWVRIQEGEKVADGDELGLALLEMQKNGFNYSDPFGDQEALIADVFELMRQGKLSQFRYSIT